MTSSQLSRVLLDDDGLADRLNRIRLVDKMPERAVKLRDIALAASGGRGQ